MRGAVDVGRRTWIDSGIWYETRKLNALERDLYLHLLINEGGNSAGYYKLNTVHLAADMGISVEQAIELLKRPTKYWMYDEETEQVLLPKYTKYNTVKGNPQLKRLNADLSQLSPCRLHKEFMKAWRDCNGIGAEELIDDKFKSIK